MGIKSGLNDLPFDRIDDFLIQYVIAEGHYTIALKAFQETLQRPVFIKLLKPVIDNHADWIRRFQQEARSCAFLKHPHITEVYRIGQAGAFHYIAMEYVEGFTLKEAGKLPLPTVVYIAMQILETLKYIHEKGVVHRDLKPANILMDTFGMVKITDFGLAYILENPSLTLQGTLVGTPAYMAPEQVTGDPITAQTDLFAVGALLYELLSGQKAFGGETYSACLHNILHTTPPLLADIPSGLNDFIAQLVEKEAVNRPESASYCLKKLKEINNKLSLDLDKETVLDSVNQLFPLKKDHIKPVIDKEEPVRSHVIKKVCLLLFFLVAAAMFIVWLPKVIRFQSPSVADMKSVENTIWNDNNAVIKDTNSVPVARKTIEDTLSSKPLVSKRITAEPVKASETEDTLIDEGEIYIDIEPWADVYINDQLVDSQVVNKQLTLQPGSYTLAFIHPNFPPQISRFKLMEGDRKTISWSFLKEAGYLWVEAQPWAHVYLDGKYIDTTPLIRPILCKTGDYMLELKHPNFTDRREVIKIIQGDTMMVRVSLVGN
jgi:serine/threonine protein kinase